MQEALQKEYQDADHWWFRARRRIFARLLDELVPLPPGARILDVGPGSGVNAPILRERGRLLALDLGRPSLRDCAEAGARDLLCADATRPPLAENSVDLLCALDVLEHLVEDEQALRAWRRVLKPTGRLLLTVPALPILWGRQDVLSDHQRRYRRGPLAGLLRRSGFAIERLSYFNTWLFAPILVVRLLMRPFLARTVRGGSDFSTATPFGLDRLLCALFASEGAWLARHDLPIGVSLIALARPQEGP